MSAKIRDMILQSSFYRSGEKFKIEDVSRMLRNNDYPVSRDSVVNVIRDMASDNLIRELPGRTPGTVATYTSVRGSRELLSKLWRPHSVQALGIGA